MIECYILLMILHVKRLLRHDSDGIHFQQKVGMRAQIIPEAPINGRHTAVVTIVDKVIDGASGTFGVRLELPNPGNKLPAGVKCKVIFP